MFGWHRLMLEKDSEIVDSVGEDGDAEVQGEDDGSETVYLVDGLDEAADV
jgi:hypothetical protein